MAPEQAEGRDAGAEADLYALALVLYEALAGVNPVRGRGAASTARRVGARLPALGRLRRDLPLDLCAAIDRAVLPRPEQRGTIEDLRLALALALPGVGDDAGTIAGSPLEGIAEAAVPRARTAPRRARARRGRRRRAHDRGGRLARPRAGAARRSRRSGPPRRSSPCSRAWAGSRSPPRRDLARSRPAPGHGRPRRRGGRADGCPPAPGGPLWSAPAIAPVLGLAGLSGAWPALAGQAARPWHRLALGALGAWWLLLAEAVGGERLATGPPRDMGDWQRSTQHAWTDVLVPIVTNGALLIAALWALAALALPYLVRGRSLALDLVGATIWAAALGSATQAVAPEMRGLVAGAVVAGGLAVAAQATPTAAHPARRGRVLPRSITCAVRTGRLVRTGEHQP